MIFPRWVLRHAKTCRFFQPARSPQHCHTAWKETIRHLPAAPAPRMPAIVTTHHQEYAFFLVYGIPYTPFSFHEKNCGDKLKVEWFEIVVLVSVQCQKAATKKQEKTKRTWQTPPGIFSSTSWKFFQSTKVGGDDEKISTGRGVYTIPSIQIGVSGGIHEEFWCMFWRVRFCWKEWKVIDTYFTGTFRLRLEICLFIHDTLQETITYPTKRKKKYHRLKSAGW